MKNIKKITTVMVSSIVLSSGIVQATAMAYDNQMDHVADMINQSSELKVVGNGIHQRKLLNRKRIQEIADVYRNTSKKKVSDVDIKKFDLILDFPNDVSIKLVSDKVNGMYIGQCSTGNNSEYFSSEENIYENILNIIKNTNQYVDLYKTGEIIREGDYAVTSVELSKATYPKAENVIITGPKGTPDTLSSAPLSGFLQAPILVTDSNKLRDEVKAEIKRLGARNIYITSGLDVVNQSVRDDLVAEGYKIVDLSSNDRYQTSEKVARFIIEKNRSNGDDIDKTILINGQNYADAPSISTFAYREKSPILLTDGKILRKETFEIIKNKENLLIVGGNKSVPKAMEDKLNNNYIKIGRLEGKDRYETSQKIVSSLFVDNNKLLISDGKDDLGAGIMAAGYCFENDRPLLMVKKGNKINENFKKKDLLYLTKKAYEDLN